MNRHWKMQWGRGFWAVLLSAGLLVTGVLSAPAVQAVTVENLRIWPGPEKTRLVFDLSDRVDHHIFTLDETQKKPHRIVIDLNDTRAKADLSGVELDGSPLKGIRVASRNQDDLRVVLDLVNQQHPSSFLLPPNEKYGHRLVVDLPVQENARQVLPEPQPVKPGRDLVIAIDAGHGGEDPGATGKGGTREKHVVLKIAKALEKQLNTMPGYRPVMIRDGDYFVNLRKRTDLARQHNADLFVSIHADAVRRGTPNGASVYALSERGATSETARWLARKENRSDLIGGDGVVSLGDKDALLRGVLLDLSMTQKVNDSLTAGTAVLDSIGELTSLHKKQVEQAGFVVLKSPDVPSILVETGFISSPKEEKKLRDKTFQKKMAKAIARGIENYFEVAAPDDTLVAMRRRERNAISEYVIARGDTLTSIARQNRVSISQLRQLNGLQNNDRIVVGQVLQVPAS